MKLCNKHVSIVHENKDCPLCKAYKKIDMLCDFIKTKGQELEEELEEYQKDRK